MLGSTTLLQFARRRSLRPAATALVVLICLSMTLPAYASTTTSLRQSTPISSSTFQDSENDCGPNPTAPFAWHFILSQLDANTAPGTLTATFQSAGTKSTSGTPVGQGKTQHFYLYTSTADTLTAASAVVATQQNPNKPHLVLSHIAEGCTSGGSSTPTPVSVSMNVGSCVLNNGSSITPVTASISPAGGATVAVKDASNKIVHTFPGDGATYNAPPGNYTWSATATSGHAIAGASSGSFTASSCASGLTPVTANAALGSCVAGSSTAPITASINPANGAVVALTKVGTGLVHTFPTDGGTYAAGPGDYTWQATALPGHVLSGTTSGAFTAPVCGQSGSTPVQAAAVAGDCSFANQTSRTPFTAVISPAGGATVGLSKVGSGLAHTFPTDGSTYSAPPGDYTWSAAALSGFSLTGATSGNLTAKNCPPGTSVLGVNFVKTQAAGGATAVLGERLANTGVVIPLWAGVTAASLLIVAGLTMVLLAPGSEALKTIAWRSGAHVGHRVSRRNRS